MVFSPLRSKNTRWSPTAKTESDQRRLQLFHVAGAARQVAVHTVEYLQSSFALHPPQISTRFRRPDDGNPVRGGFVAHYSSPNSRRICSCGIPSPRLSDA